MPYLPLPRKHARTHLPGGSDPLDLGTTLDYAWFYNSTRRTFDGSSTPVAYNAKEFIGWDVYDIRGDTFSQWTDGNGVEGVSTDDATGVYLVEATAVIFPWDTGSSNTGYLIPPKIRVQICATYDGFNFPNTLQVVSDGSQMWHRPSEEAVPAADSYANLGFITLGDMVTQRFGSGDSSRAWTVRIISSGGAHQWGYEAVNLRVLRLGTGTT